MRVSPASSVNKEILSRSTAAIKNYAEGILAGDQINVNFPSIPMCFAIFPLFWVSNFREFIFPSLLVALAEAIKLNRFMGIRAVNRAGAAQQYNNFPNLPPPCCEFNGIFHFLFVLSSAQDTSGL